jgi:hypothetical protein
LLLHNCRFLFTPYCRARRPMRPLVTAMLTYQYTYGAASPLDGRFASLVLPQVNTECTQLFITEIANRYPEENIVLVVNSAGWHQSKGLTLPENLRLHFLPPSRQNSILRSTSGTSCGRSISTTRRLTVSIPWRINSSKACSTWSSTPRSSNRLPDGTGY